MASFSPSEAALEGFRLTWERPATVLLWSAVRLVFGLAALAVLVGYGGADAAKAVAGAADPTGLSPEAASALVTRALPGLLLSLIVNLAGYAVIYAAVLRSILRPAERRGGALRLSKDELLQFLLALVVIALLFSYTLTATILLALAGTLPDPLGGVLRLLIFVAAAGGLLALLVRLSLAPAATFAAGRIRLFSAAPLTRGVFWPIFTTYLFAAILTIIVLLLAMVIFVLVVGAIGMAQNGVGGIPDALRFVQGNPNSLADLGSPRVLVNLAFYSLLATLAYALLLAPGAAVFRSLRGAPEPVAGTAPKPGNPWG